MSESCCSPKESSCCARSKVRTCGGGPFEDPRDLPPSVTGTTATPAGQVPVVTSLFTVKDLLGKWKVRWGIGRMHYTVPPGLYALGNPGIESEVLVTANYRVSFDLLRRAAGEMNAWILVLDTKGINVWCAAGKGTFGTDELVSRIALWELSKVVSHQRVIVPQLGAVGISAHDVKQRTGFEVVFGPVEADHLREFLEAGRVATPEMRKKFFHLAERAALIPAELIGALPWSAAAVVFFALAGGLLGRGPFLAEAVHSALESAGFLGAALLSGGVLAPLLLPWIPGRAFSVKGTVAGLAGVFLLFVWAEPPGVKGVSWALFTVAISSFLAMNFTGSSTFTSLSGVRKEMALAVPAQVLALAGGIVFWLGSFFFQGGPT